MYVYTVDTSIKNAAYFEAVFPSNRHFEESSICTSVDAGSTTAAAEEPGVHVMAKGIAVAGESVVAFGFGVLDFSLGPCPFALTLIFRHLS